jgi:small subunit ribosomal protein S1
MDVANRKMSMSLRQVSENPWEVFAREHQAGEIVQGKVTRSAEFGLFVEVAEGVEGLCTFRSCPEFSQQERFKQLSTWAGSLSQDPGDRFTNKKISLSIRSVIDEHHQGEVKEYMEAAVNSGSHSLGESFPQELRQKSHKAE